MARRAALIAALGNLAAISLAARRANRLSPGVVAGLRGPG